MNDRWDMDALAQVRAAALGAFARRRGCRSARGSSAPWCCPRELSAMPGKVRLWPYQREIADAISDPEIERVTLVKAVRVGFTTVFTGAIGGFVANEPCPVLCLLPTEADARDYVVSDIEPIFSGDAGAQGRAPRRRGRGRRATRSCIAALPAVRSRSWPPRRRETFAGTPPRLDGRRGRRL